MKGSKRIKINVRWLREVNSHKQSSWVSLLLNMPLFNLIGEALFT